MSEDYLDNGEELEEYIAIAKSEAGETKAFKVLADSYGDAIVETYLLLDGDDSVSENDFRIILDGWDTQEYMLQCFADFTSYELLYVGKVDFYTDIDFLPVEIKRSER